MKKQLLIGMMALVVPFTTMAAGPAAKAREARVKEIHAELMGGKAAKDLGKVELERVQNKMMEEANLLSGTKRSLSTVLKGENSVELTQQLSIAIAERKYAIELQKENPVEGAKAKDVADAAISMIANLDLVGQLPSKLLTEPSDVADAGAALKNMSKQTTEMITKWSKAEQSSWAAIEKERAALLNSGKGLSAEDALAQAISNVKKISLDEAKGLIRKAKDCA